MKKILILVALSLLLPAFLFAGDTEILGAGATFPQPLYTKMFDVYHKETGAKVNYQGIGSGGGIRQLINKTVDFGATDAFMDDQKLAELEQQIVHIPTCLGAIVITYNIPGVTASLNMTPEIVAGIFLGEITKWNDPQLKNANPDVQLPDMNIALVHRSDGSGSTFIISDYLGKVSPKWKSTVGVGKSLQWPVGLGAKGNPGVAGLIKQLPGSVGYVELTYALHNNMPVAKIKNKAGNLIEPSVETVSTAANTELPEDTRVSLTNTDAENGYPIASFTWIIVYKEQNYGGKKKDQAKATLDLLHWMVTDAQQYAAPLTYAPLSEKAAAKAIAILKSVTYDGQPLIK